MGAVAATLMTACVAEIEIDPCNQNDGECEVDFGKVFVGRSDEKTITVRNKATRDITLSPIKQGGKKFIVIPDTSVKWNLPKDETEDYRVIFQPDETKTFDGKIFFQGILNPPEGTTAKLVGEGVGLEAKGDFKIEQNSSSYENEIANHINFRERIAPVELIDAQRERVRITNTSPRQIAVTIDLISQRIGNLYGFHIRGKDSGNTRLGPWSRWAPRIDRTRRNIDGGDWIEFEIAFAPPRGKPDPYLGFIKVYEQTAENQHFAHIGLSGKAKDPPEDEETAPEGQ